MKYSVSKLTYFCARHNITIIFVLLYLFQCFVSQLCYRGRYIIGVIKYYLKYPFVHFRRNANFIKQNHKLYPYYNLKN